MKIALLGFGVVGGGVYEWCADRKDLDVVRVLVRSEKPQIAAIATKDIDDIVNDAAIDCVAEVMGGLHPAYEYVTAALKAGKHVVTANKALVASFYDELVALAKENGVAFRCTAAVGGGIPWLVNLERAARLDEIQSVGGIMNGTTNFMLDAMTRFDADFDEILAKAQALGYAEADPSADIDGDDIRRKLTISANIAFGVSLPEEEIPTFGIRRITARDISLFAEHGFTCKLLATAQRTESGVNAVVEPMLLPAGAVECGVPENFNMITYVGEKLGRQSYYGQGAGRFPTAANVVQDCLDIIGGTRAFYAAQATPVRYDGGEAHPYYVRCDAPDAFLTERVADTWADGVYITAAVPCEEMLAWAKDKDNVFVAGIQ